MTEHKVTMESTLKVLLEQKKYSTLKDILVTMNPSDVAELFGEIADERLPRLFRLLPKELAAETFIEMQPEEQELLIRGFSDAELRAVVEELYVDDAVDLVEEMPANVVRRILAQADPQMRKEINDLLQYPENSAGSIMTTEYVSLRPQMTVIQAIDRIRKTGVDKETIYTCYVTEGRKLLGTVSVKDLLLSADDSLPVSKIMDEHVISVSTLTDQEEVAQTLSKYNFLALPVVDNDGLMVSATFTVMIITGFESALAAQVVLTAFIPMLMDTGGNSGSQASVTIIRALSLGELDFSDTPKVIWKEIKTAVLCGVALATLCFVKIMLVDRMLLGNQDITTLTAFVVCFTMALTVLIAKMVGCTLPLAAKKVGFDPAVMASPFITTIVDALSLLVYFGIATALLFS